MNDQTRPSERTRALPQPATVRRNIDLDLFYVFLSILTTFRSDLTDSVVKTDKKVKLVVKTDREMDPQERRYPAIRSSSCLVSMVTPPVAKLATSAPAFPISGEPS